jgi:glucuronoarabinoxylan endo-1,4-beta-xylanase
MSSVVFGFAICPTETEFTAGRNVQMRETIMRYKFAFVIALAVLATAISAAAQSTATIDFGTTFQTIRGYGGATAWMPALTSTQANTLFGTGSNQLGLSILRSRIDPSSTTGGSSNWGTELTNAQEATALGAIAIATPWTPPAVWKSSYSTVEGSLNTSEYANYANYLESFVTFLKNGGVNLYGISMQNEPDANVTYESCVWTGAQMDTWVANNSSVLTTKLIMPESESFTTSYSDPALDDANAVEHIGIIAGHIYGVSPSYYTNAENKGKEVWMTEHYLSPSGSQPAIGDALAAAEEIHNSMTTAQYNAYVWWWVADWNPGSGVTNYGLIDTNSDPTYYGYALAQFSKFVRPGYVRASATANPNSNVFVSAYKGSSNSVIVAINAGGSSVNQPFTIDNETVSAVTPYQTTSSEHVAQLSNVSLSSNAFTYALPAQSITTFVTTSGNGGSCTTVPSSPGSSSATAASSSSINVSWSAVTPPANCTISYSVFRSTTSGFTPSSSNQIASGLTATNYSDSGLAAPTTYYYKSEAVDGAGASSPSAQASATTQSGGGSGFSCHVAYSITNQWQSGFSASTNIENTGTTNISSWTLSWNFANGQTITQLWNGSETQSGANVTVNNLSYNGSIPAGGSYNGMGFNGSWNNTTNSVPASFAINGTTCQ